VKTIIEIENRIGSLAENSVDMDGAFGIFDNKKSDMLRKKNCITDLIIKEQQ